MTLQELDEKGWIFVGKDGNAYRCCMWEGTPWLFRWSSLTHRWVSHAKLTQNDVWALPHNLTQERQDMYSKLEERANTYESKQ